MLYLCRNYTDESVQERAIINGTVVELGKIFFFIKHMRLKIIFFANIMSFLWGFLLLISFINSLRKNWLRIKIAIFVCLKKNIKVS